jgi:hypothetical protein
MTAMPLKMKTASVVAEVIEMQQMGKSIEI